MSGPGRVPSLVIEIPLEDVAEFTLVAGTFEDELRLRTWLRKSSVFRLLPVMVGRLLDDLDAADRGESIDVVLRDPEDEDEAA